MKCPKCGERLLLITGTAVVDLRVDCDESGCGFEISDDEICSSEWFDESPCSCRLCGWRGRVADFSEIDIEPTLKDKAADIAAAVTAERLRSAISGLGNIDVKLLVRQLGTIEGLLASGSVLNAKTKENLEGACNLLAALRDQIDPPATKGKS